MKFLIATDKFKGTLSATEASAAIARGILRALPDAEIEQVPIADGGEGTAAILVAAMGGKLRTCPSHDALGRPITAEYGWCTREGDAALAIIEASQANGLWRLDAAERDPLSASTFGVGEIIAHVAREGAGQILIGIGGSATNDGGAGCAAALGWRFLSSDGPIAPLTPLHLPELARIDGTDTLSLPPIEVACDVTNPLLGPTGATAVFGPQKGVTPTTAPQLEKGLARLAECAREATGQDHSTSPGAGAAGGLGFGLLAFAHATARPGFALIASIISLQDRIVAADIIITGEGSLDAQTDSGKAPAGIRALALAAGKPVFCFAGKVESSIGFTSTFALIDFATDPAECFSRPAALLEELAESQAHFMAKSVRLPR